MMQIIVILFNADYIPDANNIVKNLEGKILNDCFNKNQVKDHICNDLSLDEKQREHVQTFSLNEFMQDYNEDGQSQSCHFLTIVKCPENRDADGWMCTDIDTGQYMKELSDKKYLFKENRICNPETKETVVFELEIDLEQISYEQIIDDCKSFGYDPKVVDFWIETGTYNELIAECVFEMS